MHNHEKYELSIIMPCLNEKATIAICIKKAFSFLKCNNVVGEVIIADNGSNDGSQEVATNNGAKVINVEAKGYGNALMGGIAAAEGKYIIMGDSDDSYDFASLEPFLTKLREGYDLVIGNRFQGGIEPGAMPFLHKYFGNPTLTFLGNLFFKAGIGDFHCGLRGFKKESIQRIDLKTTGMEIASEMIVKAVLHKLRVTEVPTRLSCDGRNRPPHLRTWRDGWRHLRFLLIYSPRWLFFYPGIFLSTTGLIVFLILLNGHWRIGKIILDIHTMLFAAFAIIIGIQITLFYVFAKEYAISVELLPKKYLTDKYIDSLLLENGLLISLIFFLLGLIGSAYSVFLWYFQDFGVLEPTKIMRIVIPSAMCMALSVQFFFSSLLFSILHVDKK
jgi:glycosyltransferase involved in cell wall biosynthesis